MKQKNKFTSREQENLAEVQSQKSSVSEFNSVEELLRFDAKQTTVPSGIAQRLNHSLQAEPPISRSWWRRWLGL
ncbi:MAG: hypothetical protein WDM76_17805 [Limisphaerales bacterium]